MVDGTIAIDIEIKYYDFTFQNCVTCFMNRIVNDSLCRIIYDTIQTALIQFKHTQLNTHTHTAVSQSISQRRYATVSVFFSRTVFAT